MAGHLRDLTRIARKVIIGSMRLALLILLLLPLPAKACEVALVLAMDVSRSVDAREWRLIKRGTAEAFRNNDIIELVTWLDGGINVTVTQWSGADQQRQVLDWRRVETASDLGHLADDIEAMLRVFRFELTAPAEALEHAFSLREDLPQKCRRYVIDIAGDGVRNTGGDTNLVANAIEAEGVTINGLVVRGDTPDPLEFYLTEVQRGPLSFIEISEGYDNFPRAMFRKLLRELTPSLSMRLE